jgi:hypothetical protein
MKSKSSGLRRTTGALDTLRDSQDDVLRELFRDLNTQTNEDVSDDSTDVSVWRYGAIDSTSLPERTPPASRRGACRWSSKLAYVM